MKKARKSDGKLIQASAVAPNEAICPHCGGYVTLRQRRRMNEGGVAYFWRHLNNRNRHCSHRVRPATY